MGRKVFISVLGTGLYGECQYAKDGFISSRTPFIQIATLQYLQTQQEWKSTDTALILLTNKARELNWNKTIKSRENFNTKEKIPYLGLEDLFNDLNLPFDPQDVSISDGANEAEMWDIFNKLYDKIEEYDELYFDLTHSFRYLPMLVLVFGNYVKFLKKAIIAHISYGNYEIRENNIAPIIDLLPISALQDWTFAVANYLRNGDSKNIEELAFTAINPIIKESAGQNKEAKDLKYFIKSLKDTVEERQFCRGIGIVKSDNTKKLREAALALESTIIEPLNPVFIKIKDSLAVFDDKVNARNGLEAAKWCLGNSLFQQAITILYENLTTYICIEEDIDWQKEKERALVGIAFSITQKNIENNEEKWILPKPLTDSSEVSKARIRKILNNNHLKALVKVYEELRTLRNDINHSGMRNNPSSPDKMRKKAEIIIQKVENILGEETLAKKDSSPSVLINLSNHPSSAWASSQLEAAKAYGEVIDLAFPLIDPDVDETEIVSLSYEYFQKIKQLTIGRTPIVHLMGEMTFSFNLIQLLKDSGITCIASTSERLVEECVNGKKEVDFLFKRFREYV